MKIHSTILKIALIYSAFFLIPSRLLAQGGGILELLPGSEKMVYDEKTGTQRIIGNVNFVYQGNTMYCDSAYFYIKRNEVKAYGKVHINKNDTLNLFCDSMFYSGKTKYAKLWGNVRARDREYKITTDTLEYDAKKGLGIYRHGGKIESIVNNEVLTSRVGYFYPNTKNFIFSGKVKYKSPEVTMSTDTLRYQYLQKKVYFYGPTNIKNKDATLYCEKGWYQIETEEGVLQKNAVIHTNSKYITGDSLYHNPKQGLSVGRGNVFYRDSLEAISFEGNYFSKNDKTHQAVLSGKAVCHYKMNQDTLYIHADTLISIQDSLNQTKQIFAYQNALFFKKDLQGKCDSLIFDKAKDRVDFYREPIVWSQNAELKGEFMSLFLKDSLLDRIELLNKATSILEVDSGQYYNQIGGKKMFAYFQNEELVKVEVKGNAQTIYFPEENIEKDSVVEVKRSGMNRIYAGDLRIILDSGEVSKVTYIDKPDVVFYPMKQINKEEQFIQNFGWNPLLRPRSVEDLRK